MPSVFSFLKGPRGLCGFALAALLLAAPAALHAQDRPPERQIRAYIPPDQLVSFLPTTPFDQFVELIGPIFQRVTGKQLVNPLSVREPIGVTIAGMHFFDALELVLNTKALAYRETDRFFLLEEIPEAGPVGPTEVRPTTPSAAAALAAEELANVNDREVQINAVLFEVNTTKAREVGIDWNVFFGQSGGGQGNTGGQEGSSTGGGVNFVLKTDRLFQGLGEILETPDKISLTTLTQFFRYLETEGLGETIANPQVTVLSGERGRIQIGSDVPVQQRDFAGNTVTSFFSTGIIVDVTPTLVTAALTDTLGGPEMDFIHLDVNVEKSGSRPSPAGLIIDRNSADTQVLLLDGEQTIIGGLYSTEYTASRRGIPLLKDLPGWFFGLRYVFGYNQMSRTQKELLIVLQAELLEPLQVRAVRSLDEDLLERRRRQIQRTLQRSGSELIERAKPLGFETKTEGSNRP